MTQSISQNTGVISTISQVTQTPQTTVQNVLNAFNQNMNVPTNQVVTQIAQQTKVPKEKVVQILEHVNDFMQQSKLVESVAEKEFVKVETVQSVAQKLTSVFKETSKAAPLIADISKNTNIPAQTVQAITQSTVASVAQTPSAIQQIQTQTGASQTQIQTALNTFVQNVNQPAEIIIDKVAASSGMEKEKVTPGIEAVIKVVQSSPTIMQASATKNQVSPEVEVS